jgi:long-chain fatty acid transport protein
MKTALVVLSLVPSLALAGGFAVSEQDAAASGRMGTAVAGTAASSVHYNPAGLGLIEGAQITAGATVIFPTATATNPVTGQSTASELAVKVPPHVYGAYSFGTFALGVGFNAPFGGGLKWPADWVGSTELVEMQLQVLAWHLGGAFKINSQWSIGAAFTVYYATVALEKRIDFVDTQGTALMGGDGVGAGAGVGITWTPAEVFRLGLSGRIPARVNLAGRAHFENVPSSFSTTLPDQGIRTSVTLPAKVALGAELKALPVRLTLDAELTFWSSFDSFRIDFEDEATPDVNQPRNWQTAPTFRLGAEKDFNKTTVRLGAMLDFAASPAETLSPSLPDSTRIGFSAGVGQSFGPVRADLAYQFIFFLPRTSTGEAYPAQYNANAHLIALSLAWASQG